MGIKRMSAAACAAFALAGLAGCASGPSVTEEQAIEACKKASIENLDASVGLLGESADSFYADWADFETEVDEIGWWNLTSTVVWTHKEDRRLSFDSEIGCAVDEKGTGYSGEAGITGVQAYLISQCADRIEAEHGDVSVETTSVDFHSDSDGKLFVGKVWYPEKQESGSYICHYDEKTRTVEDYSLE